MGPFTDVEIDTLQELMNIAFGQAAAELAEVVDVYVRLHTPRVQVVAIEELHSVLADTIPDFERTSVVQQQFRGNSDGVALLIFPEGSERELISFFRPDSQPAFDSDLLFELEQDVLLEIGNILIGACIGRLFELLDRPIYYMPPHVSGGTSLTRVLSRSTFKRDGFAITLRAEFGFERRKVSGQLLLVNRQQAAGDLKQALKDYWKQFS